MAHGAQEISARVRIPTLGRRLRLGATALAAAVLAACSAQDAGPPPPAGAPPPPSVGDKPTAPDAARFLVQATFGPTENDIADLERIGYSEWMRRQFAAAAPQNTAEFRKILADYATRNESVGSEAIADIVWREMIAGQDQLRQRVAYALSEILVISYENPDVEDVPAAIAQYMDVLNTGAFGNYRTLLEDVTYSPAMGQFLTYLNNRKEDPATGRVPDENYARELMQLFTIGLIQLNPDGTPKLDGNGAQIETYSNDDITELAKVFTGLSWADNSFGGSRPQQDVPTAAYSPMKVFQEQHSPSQKSFLGVTVPAGATAETSIDTALDTLFNHPNIAPFVSKQLIQRLVTSNPSPGYVSRVTAAFATGFFQLPDGDQIGSRTRGDMKAVVAAILLDDEARDLSKRNDPAFGKVREPVIRFAHWARNANLNSVSALGGGGLNGQNDIVDASPRLAQQAYRSPSVFNFYRPGYIAAGLETASNGVVAPELQITTATTVTSFANFMRSRIEETNQTETFSPRYDSEIALAENPQGLVDRLDLVMTGNAMTPETKTRIVSAVASVPIRTSSADRDRRNRVNLAYLMTVLSSEFTVQR